MLHLLDTSALLAHFRNEPGAAQVQAIFENDDAEILLSAVSIAEFARRLHSLGAEPAETKDIIARYGQAIDEIIPVDAGVARASFELSLELPARLPLADALIAATAQSRHAILVHRDAHMRAIPSTLLDQLDLDAGP